MTNTLQMLSKDWQLSGATLIAETPRSNVYAVTTNDGIKAALKIYTAAGRRSEGTQAHVFRLWDGDGAVHCLASAPQAILLEWAGDKTAGDLTRSGQDEDAARILAETGVKLRLPIRSESARDLNAYTLALTKFDASSLTADKRDMMRFGQKWLAELLNTAPDPTQMHGDLHHDNVALSARGWLAYDPKNVWGDPHYEYANAFRNPVGGEHLSADPDRALMMADIFAEVSGLDWQRLLNWAAAKVALSFVWSGNVEEMPDHQWAIMQTLQSLAK